MIFITGDTHGEVKRLSRRAFHKSGLFYPRKGDTLLICGDFGFLWDGSRQEEKILKKLGRKKFRILFVKGTHENFDLLEKYPAEEFAGGMARRISGHLYCLENGYVFHLEGKSFFAFGGGESPDSLIRMDAGTYDRREFPTKEELTSGETRYFASAPNDKGFLADFIVTHDGPTRMRNFINLENGEMNEMHAMFDRISDDGRFGHWYFGRYHMDRKLSKKFTVVFEKILAVVPRKKKKRSRRK